MPLYSKSIFQTFADLRNKYLSLVNFDIPSHGGAAATLHEVKYAGVGLRCKSLECIPSIVKQSPYPLPHVPPATKIHW
jgi:hypothetical protein